MLTKNKQAIQRQATKWWDDGHANQHADLIIGLLNDTFGRGFRLSSIISFNQYVSNIKENINYISQDFSQMEVLSWQTIQDDREKLAINVNDLQRVIQAGSPLINNFTGEPLTKQDMLDLIDDLSQ